MPITYLVRMESGNATIVRRVAIEDSTSEDASKIREYFKRLFWTVLGIIVDDGSLDCGYQTVHLS